MRSSTLLSSRFALLAALLSLSLSAFADQNWRGTADNTWTNTANWSGGAQPVSSDLVTYGSASTANLSNWLGNSFTIKGLALTNPSGPVSINGTTTLTLTGINLSNATQTLTLSAPVSLSGAQTWGNTTNQPIFVPGTIAGSGALTKDFWGLLVLSGNNAFTGNFTDNGGPVWINNSGALGTGAKTITVANNNIGAGLHLNGTNGNIVLASGLGLTLSQQNGAIINEAGNNVINGNINVTSGGGYVYIVANAGTLALNGTVTLSATARPFALGGPANGFLNGNINNSTGLPFRKLDAGTWTMTNNNVYNGYTTVEGGTLVLAPTAKISTTTNITIFANAVLDVSAVTNSSGSNAWFLANNQVLAGSGTITGSVATVSAATIQPGSLNVAQTAGGMGVAGTLTISSNLVMGSTVTSYFELNTATTVGSGVNDLINVGGDLDPQNAQIFVTALTAPTTGTPYRLFNYGGSLASAFNATVLTDTHYTFSLDQSTANQINVSVSGGANLLWSGSPTSSLWDLNGTANWNNSTTKFLTVDPVVFDDSAATNFVSLSGTLRPGSVTFSNATVGYTLGGSGKLTGAAGLDKWNTGGLLITNTTHDFTGNISINGGVIAVSNVSSNGGASSLGAGTNILLDGGTLQYGGAKPANSLFNRYFTLGPNGGIVSTTNATFFIMNTISGPGSLTKAGGAQLILGDGVAGVLTNAVNTYTGNTYVAQNELQIRNAHALGYGKAVISSGADLAVGGSASYGTVTNDMDFNGGDGRNGAGALQVNDASTSVTFGGTLNLVADTSFGTVSNGNTVTFNISGPLIGNGLFKKFGTNIISLTGVNNGYSGGTFVNAGTLDVKADGALGSGNVTVASGATLKLESGSTHAFIASGADLLLNPGSPTVNLAFTGTPNSINALSFDGGATFKAAGTWGSATSGAAHTDSRFTGNGTLNVLTGPSSTTTVASSLNPSVYGSSVTFTSTVTPATATGTVTFSDGATVLGTAPLSSGQATFSINSLAVTNSPHAITASYSGDNNFNPSAADPFSQAVTPATLTLSGLTAQDKPYDGTAAAAVTGTPSLVGILFSDVVSLTGTATGTFTNKTVGANQPVSVAGLSLAGPNSGNYSLASLTLTASINPAGLTVTNVSATDKTYDGTTNATLVVANAALVGVVAGDDVTLITTNAVGSFADENIGTSKLVTISGLGLAGNDAGNYSLTAPTATADITAAPSATALSSSPNPSTETSNVTFTATLSSGVGTPPGDVVFLANGVPFSTNGLVSGVAMATNSLLPVGTNSIAAQFAAQGNFLASTGSLQQIVQSAVVYSQTNQILGITNNLDGTLTLTVLGTPQAQYYLLATPDVSQPTSTWAALVGSTNTVTNSTGVWSYTVTNSGPQQFYRSAAVAPAP